MKCLLILLTALTICRASTGKAVLVVAHRGASREAPENTLPAFELAWEQGADAIEGDFHLTKDGKVVCLHDRDTGKVADRKLEVSQSTLAELRTLDVGRKTGAQFRGTFIPTIAEVFATVPGRKKIYVEIKCGPEIIPALLREVGRAKLQTEQIVFISFKADVIRILKERAPAHKAYWLCSLKKSRSGALQPSLPEALTTLKKIGADGMSSGKDGIDRTYIEGLTSAGFEYHVWTVNEIAEAKRFAKLGAKSITTDLPGTIRQGLEGQ
jgi:glycerophosphoryl diester phosphodiesterase